MYEFAVTPAVTQIRRRGVTITEVEPGGLGAELELQPGDRVVRVNGHKIRDYLDFRYQTGGETVLTVDVLKPGGDEWELEIEREEGEDFGLVFENIIPRQCANECLFCFCNGNPPDARPALSFRDEDVRLSFLYGNYTTLTSITEDEMQRVIEQRLTPQYVSVHATDLKIRAYLLGVDERKADISTKLRRMMDAGIEIHAQVVLCPTINDGEILERSIRDLAAEYPRVRSVAIVPLGLTRYNTDERLTPVSPEWCRRIIKEIGRIQRELRAKLGTNFAYLGDEIYLRAGRAVPGRRHYGDYPQIEDGVGMVRSFYEDFARLWRRLEKNPPRDARSVHGTILTGKLFGPVLSDLIARLNERFGTRLRVVAVENTYFGSEIVVAGLMTGVCVLASREKIEGDFVIIPRTAHKSDEPIMLDGTSLAELEKQLGVPVRAVDFEDFAGIIESGTGQD
jgi:putative radical SAM enzyme (TIGR03279 family)